MLLVLLVCILLSSCQAEKSKSETSSEFARSYNTNNSVYQRRSLHSFRLTIYYGNCPTESHKVIRRIDSPHVCKTGGTFECLEACQSQFDEDDMEVLGGRCLGSGGRLLGKNYGAHGGYTGYGGVCVCFYCKGMGVSDTKCMEGLKEEVLEDDNYEKPLCNLEYDSNEEYDDDDIVRSSMNSVHRDTKARSDTYGGFLENVGYPVGTKHCNNKCMLLFINAEKGVCKRISSYRYECICMTCGEAERFSRYNDVPGTVNCFDINPNRGNSVIVRLPVGRLAQKQVCPSLGVEMIQRFKGRGSAVARSSRESRPCLDSCLNQFMHHPVKTAFCDVHFVNPNGLCTCLFPPCIYDTWNDWSLCSTRCNGGTRRRKRNLITGSINRCSNVIQYRPCNEQPCPTDCVVTPWEHWTSCVGYCGSGIQTRRHQVLVPPLYGGKCGVHQLSQQRICDTGYACVLARIPRY